MSIANDIVGSVFKGDQAWLPHVEKIIETYESNQPDVDELSIAPVDRSALFTQLYVANRTARGNASSEKVRDRTIEDLTVLENYLSLNS